MDTRNGALSKHIYEYLHAVGISRETYVQAVVEQYHRRVPAMYRTINFHGGGDAYKDMRANAQIVRRFLDGETKLPCEIEEALVLALPDDWQQAALAMLAARYGLLAAPIPNHNGTSDVQHLAKLVKEFGDLLNAIAPAMATNNGFGPEDAHLARQILTEAHDVQAEIVAICRKVAELIPGHKLKAV